MYAIADASSPDLSRSVRLGMRDSATLNEVVGTSPAIITKLTCSAVVLCLAVSAFSPSSLAEPAPAPEQIDQGREVYDESCQTCHGRDMVNSGAVIFDLRKFPKDDLKRFRSAVLDGKGQAMPSFRGRLGEADVDLLWAYVRGGP